VPHYALGGNLKGFFKLRIDKYRVIYTFDRSADDPIVHRVGLRDEIYKTRS